MWGKKEHKVRQKFRSGFRPYILEISIANIMEKKGE